MELDKRIGALTDIQSVTDGCHDWEFMTKKGYFADRLANFQDLSKCEYGEYVDYREHDKCFHCEVILPDGTPDYNWFSYFIPEDSLLPVEPEKKYRPFSLNEFLCRYAISDLISYRIKDCEVVEQSMFIGFQSNDDEEDIPGNGYVLIGNCRYSLKELFNNYDLKAGGEWQPFGVIDEDKE